MTIQKNLVKDIWPEAKFKLEIFYSDSGSCSDRNIVIKSEWKLSRASSDVFSKLRDIQTALYLAMIPYNLWPQRVAIEMDGDFILVRRIIGQFDVSWMQTLEAFFETLDNHEMLQEPVPEFARLAPYKDESYLDYAWRVRNRLFNLPMYIRGSNIVRGIAIKNIKT